MRLSVAHNTSRLVVKNIEDATSFNGSRVNCTSNRFVSRPSGRRASLRTVARVKEGSSEQLSTFDVFPTDLSFIKSALDPQDREGREIEALQDNLVRLQAELDQAHAEVHRSEVRVKDSLGELRELESVVGNFQDLPGAQVVAKGTASTRPTSGARNAGLHSSLDLEPELAFFWYPMEFTSSLTDNLVPVTILGEDWIIFRDEDGVAACKSCNPAKVTYLPVKESDGLVFVWPSEDVVPDVEPLAKELLPPNSKFLIHSELSMEVPVEHGLLLENLLDLAHAPFTHTSTFAKGWSIPEAVTFKMRSLLAGNWEPYPIDMTFLPPCMVLSHVGMEQPGTSKRASECKNHLHQLHVCIPSRPGHTRLLYRMSLDFMPWLKLLPAWIPDKFWKWQADMVLGEDLVLVEGQQYRMKKGSSTWNMPVAYDKLAVKYRRWRNGLWKNREARTNAVTMSAGEMLIDDESLE